MRVLLLAPLVALGALALILLGATASALSIFSLSLLNTTP